MCLQGNMNCSPGAEFADSLGTGGGGVVVVDSHFDLQLMELTLLKPLKWGVLGDELRVRSGARIEMGPFWSKLMSYSIKKSTKD